MKGGPCYEDVGEGAVHAGGRLLSKVKALPLALRLAQALGRFSIVETKAAHAWACQCHEKA